MAFNNPIAAFSGALTFPSIHSPNWQSGVAGWTINRDGTAEFNSLGGTLQISNFGIFFYVPNAGTGNLRVSIATAGGTDPYGNVYKAGLFINQKQVWATGDGGHTVTLNPDGQSGPEVLFTPSGLNAIVHILADGAGNRLLIQATGGSGAKLVVDAGLSTVQPSTVNTETWHAASYGTGWSDGASPIQGLSFRLNVLNNVEFKGGAANASAAVGQTIATLPAGYRPPFARTLSVFCRTTSTMGAVSFNTDGTVVVSALPSGGHTLEFDGLFFSLDS